MDPAVDAITLAPVKSVDIGIFVQYYNSITDSYALYPIQGYSNIANDGEERIKVNFEFSLQCLSLDSGIVFNVCPIIFKITVSNSHVLPPDSGIWSGIAFLNSDNSSDVELAEECEEWSESTQRSGLVALLDTLPPCPPTLPLARFDITYQREDMISQVTQDQEYHKIFMSYFHPNIKVCYIQSM